MELKLRLILGLIVAIAFPIASIYVAWSGGEGEVPAGPELALEAAIDYVISNHEELEGLEAPESSRRENITPKRLVGATTLRFTGGDWTATVMFAPISPSAYKIEIDYAGEGGFHWEGQVYRDGNVVETAFTLAS